MTKDPGIVKIEWKDDDLSKAELDPGVARIEWHSGDLRYWAKSSDQYGTPFEWSCGLCRVSYGVVEVTAVDKPITPKIWRAIKEACREQGFKKIIYTRYDEQGNQLGTKEIEL